MPKKAKSKSKQGKKGKTKKGRSNTSLKSRSSKSSKSSSQSFRSSEKKGKTKNGSTSEGIVETPPPSNPAPQQRMMTVQINQPCSTWGYIWCPCHYRYEWKRVTTMKNLGCCMVPYPQENQPNQAQAGPSQPIPSKAKTPSSSGKSSRTNSEDSLKKMKKPKKDKKKKGESRSGKKDLTFTDSPSASNSELTSHQSSRTSTEEDPCVETQTPAELMCQPSPVWQRQPPRPINYAVAPVVQQNQPNYMSTSAAACSSLRRPMMVCQIPQRYQSLPQQSSCNSMDQTKSRGYGPVNMDSQNNFACNTMSLNNHNIPMQGTSRRVGQQSTSGAATRNMNMSC